MGTNAEYVDVRVSNRGLIVTARTTHGGGSEKETKCEKMYREIWGRITMSKGSSTKKIFSLLHMGQVVAATDGGIHNKRCAHAWYLAEKKDGNTLVKGYSKRRMYHLERFQNKKKSDSGIC